MPIDDSPSIGGSAMNATWHQADCTRPDPYLEWEYRTRREKQQETWCSVQIRVIPSGEEYLPSLCELKAAVDAGRQADDDVSSDFLTIRMADDERTLLEQRIDCLQRGGKIVNKVEVQFFIYRWEPLIYLEGDYRNSLFYEIIFPGPPIAGLAFNALNPKPDPLKFRGGPLLTANAVAIGIIDDGIAFAHQRFRNPSQKSRIEAIWLQETERRNEKDNSVVFGQRLDGACIDGLIATCSSEDRIYREVGLTDFGNNLYNPLASRATHGTHVLDLASGGESDRPVFAVQLPSTATIDTSGVTMGSYVLQAVRMIMIWADGLSAHLHQRVPLVINFSYGLLAGPKDGRQPIERALAELIEYRNCTAATRLVMPAGNSYRTRAAARFELKDDKPQGLDWVVLPDDGATNYLEVWLDGGIREQGDSPVEVSLTPQCQSAGEVIRPVQGVVSEFVIDGRPVAGIYYQAFDDLRQRILLAINPTVRNLDGRDLAPAGRWRLSIRNLTEQTITAHLYVQRDDTPFGYPRRGRQSYLDHPGAYERDEQTGDYRVQGPECPIIYQETLSAIATSSEAKPDHTIVVGAAEASECCPPADYTSSGPTKSRPGPDCSAIADEGDAHWGMLAAGTFSGSVVRMRGTSVAAPQIVRQIADDLAAMSLNARGATDAVPGASSGPPPNSIKVPDGDHPRLGPYVIRPAENNDVPRRRYPAI
jgi:hypothetical protein